MLIQKSATSPDSLRRAIHSAYLADETECITALLQDAQLDPEQQQRVTQRAHDLVTKVRAQHQGQAGIDAFMHEYDLSSQEGILLMCLAEALLRIPDPETADRLIRDKLTQADWDQHLGRSDSLMVNAATWSLMLTGRIIRLDPKLTSNLGALFSHLISRSSEPVIRTALKEAMRIMGHQFVMGRSIEEALSRSQKDQYNTYLYSFDMLGEAALTKQDAKRYLKSYEHAITAIGETIDPQQDVVNAAEISVKLTALHPRFDYAHRERVMEELVPNVINLCHQAMLSGINLTLDAEEAERLDLTLDVFEAVFKHTRLSNWDGLGLAVQAYQKRAVHVIDWLVALSRSQHKRIMLRLVKGAYWDTEIKRAQERGLRGYPVFTRKASTDVSYLACAKRILQANDSFYAQFATHNAYTVAAILEMITNQNYEFQRLHGMGEILYNTLLKEQPNTRCRTYAPVGSHEDLLPYLVRRLLENGANTSFVNRIEDASLPVEELIIDPLAKLRQLKSLTHPHIPLPADLYGATRRNSLGLNLYDPSSLITLAQDMETFSTYQWQAGALINGELQQQGAMRPIYSPADHRQKVGQVVEATTDDVFNAIRGASQGTYAWMHTDVKQRAEILERTADLIEQHRVELMALCIREGGRCIPDALAEVREAIDFCRYYASLARNTFEEQLLAGPAGEQNSFTLHGRGIFVCISPWNFPLAIFTGQITAALVAGNTVIAKPARQTPLVAARVVQLLLQAGVPTEVLHLLPGGSGVIAKPLLNDTGIAGVALTGSTETAWHINQILAKRNAPIVPFIAETGGQNVMIADSSALPEQVINDAIRSAFNSAGQRCSALRVLFVQQDIKPRILELLKGAMAELDIGDPLCLSTDVGPVIDQGAKDSLLRHKKRMQCEANVIYDTDLPEQTQYGSYVGPAAYEIEKLSLLKEEVFGPILHVIGYSAHKLDDVIKAVNDTGFGLTLGIHSRIEATARYIQQRVCVGNIYVNRDMIGAVVGVQPFGGQGLSGTGPKAGGPHYLYRFATECTVTTNTSAIGGNASLLSMGED